MDEGADEKAFEIVSTLSLTNQGKDGDEGGVNDKRVNERADYFEGHYGPFA